MSVSYKLTIRRAHDEKVIAASIENCIKSILAVDEEAIPTHGERFRMSDIQLAAKGFADRMDELRADIEKKEEGIFGCKSVEVKREIEEDINWKRDSLKDYRRAYESCYRLIGVVCALTENMLFGNLDKDEDGDSEGSGDMAYHHFGVKTGTNASGYEEWEYSWAEDAILSVTAD